MQKLLICLLFAVFALFASVTVCGCDTLHEICLEAEFCDAPIPDPVLVDLVCDRTPGSTCNNQSLEQNLNQILSFIAKRPQSELRVWVLGTKVSDTVMVRSYTSTSPAKTGSKALSSHEKNFLVTTKADIISNISNTVKSSGKTRSPLIEGLSKVTMSGNSGGFPRIVILVSDGREFSKISDFECAKKLPSEKELLEKLGKKNLLKPDSLKGSQVFFSFINSSAIQGRKKCPDVTIYREQKIQDLWRGALTRAGATQVTFETGAVKLNNLY